MIEDITKLTLKCMHCNKQNKPQTNKKCIPWQYCQNCSDRIEINGVLEYNSIAMFDNRIDDEKVQVSVMLDTKKMPQLQSDSNDVLTSDEIRQEYILEGCINSMSLDEKNDAVQTPNSQAETNCTQEDAKDERLRETLNDKEIVEELEKRSLVVDFDKEDKRLFCLLQHDVLLIDSKTKVYYTDSSTVFHIRRNCGSSKNQPVRFISKDDIIKIPCKNCFVKYWNKFISEWLADHQEFPEF